MIWSPSSDPKLKVFLSSCCASCSPTSFMCAYPIRRYYVFLTAPPVIAWTHPTLPSSRHRSWILPLRTSFRTPRVRNLPPFLNCKVSDIHDTNMCIQTLPLIEQCPQSWRSFPCQLPFHHYRSGTQDGRAQMRLIL
jgi:hypothetical protein